MASISIRESIRWLPEEASEPTSTVVLTSPGRRFVDLRVLHAGGDEASGEDVVTPERLDWAIAGTSSSVATPERGPRTTHSQWRHWIDSRTLDVEAATDEGYMSPLGGGRTLEEGRMANPATGRQTDYEEVWVDEDPRPVPGDAGRQIVVLDFEGAGASERGRVVRLGRLCQGLLRVGDDVRAERWEWTTEGGREGGGEGWRRSKSVGGGGGLPCEAVLLAGWDGKDVTIEGRTWTAVEAEDI